MARSTLELLEEAGYDYRVVLEEEGVEPERVKARFEDFHPGLASTRLAGLRLYRHQLEAVEALGAGLNVILVSGTGSGKTEAWFLHVARAAASGGRLRVLAVYPTLALAWDQLARLEEYGRALGLGVARVDSLAKKEVRGLRSRVRQAWVVVTNPAMLLEELKKHLAKPGGAVLSPALEDLDLLVVDELDYYDPRSLSLLLGMIELLAAINRGRLRVAALTATLANPGDLARFLERVTGAGVRVVPGKPFHPPNRVIVVLGKDLEGVRERILKSLGPGVEALPREVREALRDPSLFAEKAYMVVDYLRSQGVEAPSIGVDPVEILSWYARGEAEPPGVTLAFTGSINEAERLARQLRERLGADAGRVAAHHHLVPKEERRRIEEAARRGEVKVILTPRTLTQGVDIGTVVRVVHVGLPGEVREYWQREGRKGRRPGIPFTESLIIPRGRWDRELLRRGVEALKAWVSLPLEKAWVDPDSHYKALLTGAAKLLSPHPAITRGRLTGVEEEALRAAGVLGEDGRVDSTALNRLWRFLNFYEYGPPYPVRRVLEEPGGAVRELEPIGRCDLVEKFQPGCLDPGNDAVVVGLVYSRQSRSRVSRVVEWRIARALEERRHPWLLEALDQYASRRASWGEEPRFLTDYARGLVESEAETVVYPPRRGFGLLRKVPYRCVWRVVRRRPRAVVDRDGRVHVYREVDHVHVAAEVGGEYRDYTYGVEVEAPPGLSPDEMRLGLAVLNVYLRMREGIPLGLLKYSVYALGGRALVEVHEESAAGVLPRLDWLRVAREVREYQPGPIDDVLLLSVDEYAYLTLAALGGVGFDWSRALEAAALMAEALAAPSMLEVRLAGLRIGVPRPSRGRRLASIAALAEDVEVEGYGPPFTLAGLAYYDGSTARSAIDLYLAGHARRPPRSLLELEHDILDDAYYEGFTLLVFGREAVAGQLRSAGLHRLAAHIEAGEGVVDVYEEAVRAGLPLNEPGWLIPHIDVEGGLELPGVGMEEAARALARFRQQPRRRPALPRWLTETLGAFLEREAVSVYLAHLALERIVGGGGAGSA